MKTPDFLACDPLARGSVNFSFAEREWNFLGRHKHCKEALASPVHELHNLIFAYPLHPLFCQSVTVNDGRIRCIYSCCFESSILSGINKTFWPFGNRSRGGIGRSNLDFIEIAIQLH